MAAISDDEFVRQFEAVGAHAMARANGIQVRNIYARRRRIEERLGRSITSPDKRAQQRPGRALAEIDEGFVVVGGDGHYWPGPPPVAHMAYCQIIKELKPEIVILNGDVFDGSSISRHPPINWTSEPTVYEELEVCKERVAEIERVSDKVGAKRYWSLGNHDNRFEAKIALHLPELAKVEGTALHDHFSPTWTNCYSVQINNDVIVKHRLHGGQHAAYNNTLRAGVSICTNHLHSPKVIPYTDYRGTRYGVDTGCLADTFGEQFLYLEDNNRNWMSGFAVLQFKGSRLMPPELCLKVSETEMHFRGRVWEPAEEWHGY